MPHAGLRYAGAGAGQVLLEWSVSSALSAVAYFELAANGSVIYNGTASSFVHSAAPGATLAFTATVVDTLGLRAAGAAVIAVVPAAGPSAPAISVAATGASWVNLQWTANPSLTYRVDISAGGSWTPVSLGSVGNVTVTGLQPATAHTARLQARAAGGVFGAAATVAFNTTVPAVAVTALAAAVVNSTAVRVARAAAAPRQA